ncbi:MAG: response regulator RpfG family c-di-GMP phosphodiesterase [Bacteroidia bacterium]|jgi:response regulator RpfG family c-di-GMP phosphodiesterase
MIYLIDDDEIQNLINSRIIGLIKADADIKTFTSAEVALRELESLPKMPDLIFLDINMPKMNGWDFLDAFTEKTLKAPVYLLSSSINKQDFDKSETYEVVNGFISKPLMEEKLSEVLSKQKLL